MRREEELKNEIRRLERKKEELKSDIRGLEREKEELISENKKFNKTNLQIQQQTKRNNERLIDDARRELYRLEQRKNEIVTNIRSNEQKTKKQNKDISSKIIFEEDINNKEYMLKEWTIKDLAEELNEPVESLHIMHNDAIFVVLAEYFRRNYNSVRWYKNHPEELEKNVNKVIYSGQSSEIELKQKEIEKENQEVEKLIKCLSQKQQEEIIIRKNGDFFEKLEMKKYYEGLKDLYFSIALSPVMKKYIISCYSDDMNRAGFKHSEHDCDRVILSLICTMPEEMQLPTYRMLRNNEMKNGRYSFANNFRNIDKSVSDRIHMLQRKLTPQEVLEGIEKGEDFAEKLRNASEWVSKILDHHENKDTIELICKKYRNIAFIEEVFKEINNNNSDYLSYKVALYRVIKLFVADYTIDENWLNEFKYIESVISKFPDEDREDVEDDCRELYERINITKLKR